MSIKQWKQVITITVVATIIILFILTIVFAIRSYHLKNFMESDNVIIMSEDRDSRHQDLKELVRYFEKATPKGNLSYKQQYPALYVENTYRFIKSNDKEKVCYLTFDDGPDAENTAKILDILQQFDIHATFFVVYKDDEASNLLYNRIVKEGHTIAVHTASHDYDEIYSSVSAYLKDFSKISSHIIEVTGIKPEIFRFPGGSVNAYNIKIHKELTAEMLRRGYVYYDWTVSGGDAAKAYVSSSEIVENVVSGCEEESESIVLLHDDAGHYTTAEALPEIIRRLKNQGFSFAALDNSVNPCFFGY